MLNITTAHEKAATGKVKRRSRLMELGQVVPPHSIRSKVH
jgi:hypothetical protein